jgi:hypothetical protein
MKARIPYQRVAFIQRGSRIDAIVEPEILGIQIVAILITENR